MAQQTDYPNTKVGMEQGGDTIFLDNDGYFRIDNVLYTGAQIAGLAKGTRSVTLTNLSTGSTVLSDLGGSSPPVLHSEYGTIFLSCTGTMTNGSARAASAYAGQRLHIRFNQGTGSTGSVLIYFSGHASGVSGVRCMASTGSDLSSITMQQSAASYAWIDLIGIADGIWAVGNTAGVVAEQPA